MAKAGLESVRSAKSTCGRAPCRFYPPAIAPTTRNGSAPAATASGSGVSGGSCEKSCSQAKKRTNGRRLSVSMIADRAAQHRVARFERVEHGAAA